MVDISATGSYNSPKPIPQATSLSFWLEKQPQPPSNPLFQQKPKLCLSTLPSLPVHPDLL